MMNARMFRPSFLIALFVLMGMGAGIAGAAAQTPPDSTTSSPAGEAKPGTRALPPPEPSPPDPTIPTDGAAPTDTTGAPLSSRVRLDFLPDSTEVETDEHDGRRIVILSDTDHWWEDTKKQHYFDAVFRYNRVEGVALYAVVGRRLPTRGHFPAYRAGWGYGFSSKRGYYELELEQPVVDRNKLILGVKAYRQALSFWYGEEVIGDCENTASAILVRRDYRDYFEAEGGRVWLGSFTSPFVQLDLGITARDEKSQTKNTNWSVFNAGAEFRENPEATDGEYIAFDAAVTFDTRPPVPTPRRIKLRPRSTWGSVEYWYRLEWERADGGLGGDFDHWRVTADLRNYFRLSPRQSISTRILAGAGESSSGRLPPQRRYFLGGLSTLRGHNFRSIEGDRVALANFQYAFNVTRRVDAMLFLDAGTAWDEGSLTAQFIPVDIGAGLRLGENGITFMVAQGVNRSDAQTKFIVRFQESF